MMRFFKLFIFLLITAGFIYGGENYLIKLAVLDVTSRTVMKEVDRLFLTERIQIELSKYKGLTIVERIELKRIIDEQKLQLSGIAEKDAVKIGNLIGADKIVTGSLTEVDGSFFLTVKVIDVGTSEIDFIDQISGESTPELSDKIKEIAKNIAQTLFKENVVLRQEETPREEKKEFSLEEKKIKEVKKTYWFPFGIYFVPSIQLPPSYFNIRGGAFGFIGGYENLYGFQFGFMNSSQEVYGIQDGFLNFSKVKMIGVQVGFINNAYEIKGVQIGFLNFAYNIKGVQLGFLNFIRGNGLSPMMFGINIGF